MWTQIGKPEIIKRERADRELVRLQESHKDSEVQIVREAIFNPITDCFVITTWERLAD